MRSEPVKLSGAGRTLGNAVFVMVLLVAAIVLYQFAARHLLQWDVTQSAANTLQDSSVDVLRQMPDAIRITVYASGQDAELGDVQRLVRDFVALYQRYKPDIVLGFVDPLKQPEEARKVSISANGEMLVQYGGRTEHLTVLSEQALTSALLRLAHGSEKLVMYLDGHGERKLDGGANHDLGEFGKRLQQNGYRIAGLNLTLAQDVPQNAGLLLITQPQIDLLPGEVDKLLRYVERGGNILWLLDAEPMHGLEPLAERLGLLLTPGIVIDPGADEMRAPANWALAAGYPPHPATRNFSLITVFPYARALGVEESESWQQRVLVEVAPRGWVSTRPLQGKPKMDKARDAPGPVAVALALQRDVGDREQRVIAVGSGAFLANAYSGNGGNIDLGVNLVNWLANEERLIAMQPRAVKDGSVTLGKTGLAVISVGWVIVLPLMLMLAGILVWWRRRQ